jgi:hypothetical protein
MVVVALFPDNRRYKQPEELESEYTSKTSCRAVTEQKN